jgi:hypothetical protein
VAGNFFDIDANDVLSYSARLTNGNRLPDWLAFDVATGLFSGKVPTNVRGGLEIRVTASDGHGQQSKVSDVFRADFGRSGSHEDDHDHDGDGCRGNDRDARRGESAFEFSDHDFDGNWAGGYDRDSERGHRDREEREADIQDSLAKLFARGDIDLEAVERAMEEFDHAIEQRHRQESRWEQVEMPDGAHGNGMPTRWVYMVRQLDEHLNNSNGAYEGSDMGDWFGRGREGNPGLLGVRNVLCGSQQVIGAQSFQSLQGLQEGVARLG